MEVGSWKSEDFYKLFLKFLKGFNLLIFNVLTSCFNTGFNIVFLTSDFRLPTSRFF